jgi:hypothetical protein
VTKECAPAKRQGEIVVSQSPSGQAIHAERGSSKPEALIGHAVPKSSLTKLAAWIHDRRIPFLVSSIGMVVMLLWAGSYKMTAPGAEGIIPLVSNSPLVSWHFKLFGPYIGSDLIGLTEMIAAVLIIAGYWWPKAGIVSGLIASGMFFITHPVDHGNCAGSSHDKQTGISTLDHGECLLQVLATF